jgi:hypothetical protein
VAIILSSAQWLRRRARAYSYAMIAFEISERRELDGAHYVRVARHRDSSQRGLSGSAQFIGDILNQTSHERELATGILQQAKADLWRFRKSKDKAGREVYSDALSWFLSNDAEWACSFRNVCRFLGLSPEELRERVFTDAHSGWVAHSGRLASATATQGVGSPLASLLVSPQQCSRTPTVMKRKIKTGRSA